MICEIRLTKSFTNDDVNINGYTIYRTKSPKKGGGVAIYVKSRFEASIVNVEIAKPLSITVVGCYRHPSATEGNFVILKAASVQINKINKNEK